MARDEATLLMRSRQKGFNLSPVIFITDQLPVPNSHKNNNINNIIKKKRLNIKVKVMVDKLQW